MKTKYFIDYFFIFACLLGSSMSLLRCVLLGSFFSFLLFAGNFLMAYVIAETMISDKELDAKRGKIE